jgi:transcriptional repressor NrdR
MKCPFCNEIDTVVKETRAIEDGSSIRRRRYCPSCSSRFTTFERLQLRDLFVIKNSGARKIFDRDKISRSISTALRKREISQDQIEKIVNNLVRQFESLGENEIPTSLIGEAIMNELSKLDLVAYVRFASVYKDFANAKDFEKFIKKIKNES